MDITEFKKRLPEMQDLLTMKNAASDAYTAAIKANSETLEVNKTVLRKIVSATLNDATEAAKVESEELIGIIEALQG